MHTVQTPTSLVHFRGAVDDAQKRLERFLIQFKLINSTHNPKNPPPLHDRHAHVVNPSQCRVLSSQRIQRQYGTLCM